MSREVSQGPHHEWDESHSFSANQKANPGGPEDFDEILDAAEKSRHGQNSWFNEDDEIFSFSDSDQLGGSWLGEEDIFNISDGSEIDSIDSERHRYLSETADWLERNEQSIANSLYEETDGELKRKLGNTLAYLADIALNGTVDGESDEFYVAGEHYELTEFDKRKRHYDDQEDGESGELG